MNIKFLAPFKFSQRIVSNSRSFFSGRLENSRFKPRFLDPAVRGLRTGKHRLFLAQRDLRTRREARALLSSGDFKNRYRELEKTFELPPLPTTKGVWAVAMVKNEADVLERSLRHLHAQGVARILVVDNGSDDGTFELLQRLSRELPLSIGRDREPAYYQSEKMTYLTHRAQRAGATWVVPFDADEFWFGVEGTLAEVLSTSKNTVEISQLYNLFPTASGDLVLDTTAHFDPKVCFKSWRSSVVTMGNHRVLRPGAQGTDRVVILHLPWRSRQQLQRKLMQGAKALELTDLPEDLGYHWRKNGELSEKQLADIWLDLIAGRPIPVNLAWQPRGSLYPLGSDIPQDAHSLKPFLEARPETA